MLMPSIFNTNLFDDFFDFPFYDDTKAEKKLYGHHAANLMKTDIQEHDDGYTLEMDLPGFKKDEIKVELNNGYMTISAAKGLDEDEKDKKSGKYIRRERYYGAYTRSFNVSEIDVEGIKAAYENGVLTLTMPKKAPVKPESKHLEIE